MTLSLHQLGPNLKKHSHILAALVVTIDIFINSTFFPLSTGDRYFSFISRYYRQVEHKQYTKADKIESKLDNQDIIYFAKFNHPKYISTTIKDTLQKQLKNADDLVEIALLYCKIDDLDNCRHFLLLAQQTDPVRSDIGKLLQQLF